MKKLLTLAAFLFMAVPAMSQCLTDSMVFTTNDTDWRITSNSYGQPNNVFATVVTPQENSISGYPDAKWISCMSNWIVITSTSDPDDSIAYRYQLRMCTTDTVHFSFTFRRDNYANIYIDGNLFWSDPVVFDPNYINMGDLVDTTFILDSSDHTIDIVDYNRNSFNGTNGVGMLIGGYIKSKHNSMIKKSSPCAAYVCPDPASAKLITSDAIVAKVYPNPVGGDELFIELWGISGNVKGTLSDITGRTVQSMTLNNKVNALQMKDLPAGLYLLKMNGSDKVYKIMKK